MKRKATVLLMFMAAAVLCSGCRQKEEGRGSAVSEERMTEEEKETADTKDRLLAGLQQAGITEYEKIDLSPYEKQAGISLSDAYISYRFFYESDGLQIEAYISAPMKALESNQTSSCLIFNHGGNRDYGALGEIDTCYYAYRFQTICIASNYRGCGNSEGTDEFGGDDVNDVIHLIDLCEKLPYIDKEKINMLGISRGGMMTYETLRADKRVHRAAVVSGTADSFLGYADRDDMKEIYKELVGGTPEELPKEYEKRSATYWAEEIDTPVMIFHASGDQRVSIAEAEKLAEKLEEAGKEYEYISYEADTHGEIREEDVSAMLEWFGK